MKREKTVRSPRGLLTNTREKGPIEKPAAKRELKELVEF
jgi:hypothetical protein